MIHLQQNAEGQMIERFESWEWVLHFGGADASCVVCGSPIHEGSSRWRRVPFNEKVRAHTGCVKAHKRRGQ